MVRFDADEATWTKVVLVAEDSCRQRFASALRHAGYDVVEFRDCAGLAIELFAGRQDDDNPRDVDLLIVHGGVAESFARSGLLEAHLALPPIIWLAARLDGEHLVVQLLRRVEVMSAECATTDLVEAARQVTSAAR